jgi:hypothetical protein
MELVRLRPAYNGTALAAAVLVTGPHWSHALTASTSEGPLAPLGLTAFGLLAAWRLDRTRYADRHGIAHDWWIPRVLVWTVAVTGPATCAATHAPILNILTGAAS